MTQEATHNPEDRRASQVEDEDGLEIPSCIESLTSSAGQLRQLASQAKLYYNKLFLCYGYACEPHSDLSANLDASIAGRRRSAKANGSSGHADGVQRARNRSAREIKSKPLDWAEIKNDKQVAETMKSMLEILPILTEFSGFIERCSATIEATIKRATFYLCKPGRREHSALKDATFQLTKEVRVDTLFVALMDLMFALVCLNETIKNHTDIRSNLNLFVFICKQLSGSYDDASKLIGHGKPPPERRRILKLIEYVNNLIVSLGAGDNCDINFFKEPLTHVEHLNLTLSKDKTKSGFDRLCQLFEDYLILHSEHLLVQTIDHNNPKMTKTLTNILVNTNLIFTNDMNTQTRRVFGLVTLYILYCCLFNKSDKKVKRAINQAIQRIKPSNIILLEGSNCCLLLDEFLKENASRCLFESKTYECLSRDLDKYRDLDANVEFEQLLMKSIPWMIKLKSESLDYALGKLQDWPQRQIVLIDKGLRLVEEISSTIRNLVIARAYWSVTLTKNDLIPLFRLNALLKSIHLNFEQQNPFITTCLTKVELFVRSRCRQLLGNMQKREISMKYSERKLDLDSTVILTSICSRAELLSSPQGRDTLSICLSMLLANFNQTELQSLNSALGMLRLDFHKSLECWTKCHQLYWQIPTLSVYYNYVIETSPTDVDELHYLHEALGDIEDMFDVSDKPVWSNVDADWIINRSRSHIENLSNELLDRLKIELVDRICQEFEVELRLQTHRDLYKEEHGNPFKRHHYNFKQIIKQRDQRSRFRILNKSLDMRYSVEQHLNRNCYNLTAIAPHDWHTHDSMMNLARHKHNLTFVNTQLPAQTLDSGLDLLDITRNLSLFASRYTYDLTNQLFIEKCANRTSSASSIGMGSMLSSYASASSSSQSLNVIEIKHVAQSIQTHGFGVLDSAVNCTYQALKRLINLFARQVSDDKLRATLQREHQQITSSSQVGSTLQQDRAHSYVMSFERANRIAKRFKLSITHLTEASSLPNQRPPTIDLDSIRQTVTQLGNLLGFIRLIKSSALSCVTQAVDYLPDLDDLYNLQMSSSVENEFSNYLLYEPLLSAAKNLDQCLVDFKENFSPKTNYFRIVVSIFKDLLSGGQDQDQSQTTGDQRGNKSIVTEEGSASGEGRGGEQVTGSTSTGNGKRKRDHLNLFFVLVPALVVNYIDYLINCKERASSRSSMARFGALISDDGFAIGVAFLLTVLGQTGEHNKLDWLQQTCTKLQEDILVIQQRLEDSKLEESLRQTSSMTVRRLTRLHVEYMALDHALDCAFLLFAQL